MSRRNIALGLAVAAYMLSFFHRVAPAALAPDLAAAFQIGAASLGSLSATYFYVYTLMQLPTGVLVDTLGPRKTFFSGGLIAGLGSLLFALAPSFEIAVIGRTLVGVGVSVAFIAMLKLIAVWYEESRFATLLGLCVLLGNLGSMLAGAPLSALSEVASWREIFAGIGLLSLALGVASYFLIDDSPVAAPPSAARSAWLKSLVAVLANRATWPCVFVGTGISGSFYAFAGLWAVPFFTQVLGMSRAVAANHISVYFLGFAVGAALLGKVSDRIKRRKPVLVLASLLHALGWLVWLSGATLPVAASYPLCLAMGILTGSMPLAWACVKEVNSPLLSGTATSLVNVGAFLGPAILQPLIGWLMDRSWDGSMHAGARFYAAVDYRQGLLLMAGTAAAAFVAALFLRETRGRNVWHERRA